MEVIQIILTSFIAGIVLNFMPCVLPILGIKLQSLRGFSSKMEVKQMCIFTSLGIMLFMLLTAGIFQMFNFFFWGFQLQSPLFVSFLVFMMVFLFFLSIGKINFNLNIQYSFKSKILESFFYGLLIVVFSISCTAPVIGSAITFASLSKSNLWVVMFFIGLGLCAPYLLFIFFPNILLKINKARFFGIILKYLSSFLILCTIAFLCYVFYTLIKGVIFLKVIVLVLLLVITTAGALRFAKSKSILTLIYTQLVIWGLYFSPAITVLLSLGFGGGLLILTYSIIILALVFYGVKKLKEHQDCTILVINSVTSLSLFLLMLFAFTPLAIVLFKKLKPSQLPKYDEKVYPSNASVEDSQLESEQIVSMGDSSEEALLLESYTSQYARKSQPQRSITVVPFTEERLTDFISKGNIVIVNFDASWCINCKGNNLMTFNTEEFKEYVTENNIIFMKADVTIKNPSLENFMAKFGVYAVPFTAVFSGKHPEGKLMPAFLTTQILIKEIEDYGF